MTIRTVMTALLSLCLLGGCPPVKPDPPPGQDCKTKCQNTFASCMNHTCSTNPQCAQSCKDVRDDCLSRCP